MCLAGDIVKCYGLEILYILQQGIMQPPPHLTPHQQISYFQVQAGLADGL